jgi:hypothetical protein
MEEAISRRTPAQASLEGKKKNRERVTDYLKNN